MIGGLEDVPPQYCGLRRAASNAYVAGRPRSGPLASNSREILTAQDRLGYFEWLIRLSNNASNDPI
jgi:hypothetical protein